MEIRKLEKIRKLEIKVHFQHLLNMSPREKSGEEIIRKIIQENFPPLKNMFPDQKSLLSVEKWTEKKPNPRALHCEISGHKAREDSRSYWDYGRSRRKSHTLKPSPQILPLQTSPQAIGEFGFWQSVASLSLLQTLAFLFGLSMCSSGT